MDFKKIKFYIMLHFDYQNEYCVDQPLLKAFLEILERFGRVRADQIKWHSGRFSLYKLPCMEFRTVIADVDVNMSAILEQFRSEFYRAVTSWGVKDYRLKLEHFEITDHTYDLRLIYATTEFQVAVFDWLASEESAARDREAAAMIAPVFDNRLVCDLKQIQLRKGFGKNEFVLGYGIRDRLAIKADMGKNGHLCLVGGTGSGKSMATLYLIYSVRKSGIPARFFIGDFKKSGDYEGISEDYGEFDAVPDLIDRFYMEFEATPENPSDFKILLLDEYAGLVTHLSETDKKRAENIKKKIANLLMLGRSRHCFVWCIQQRMTATLFPAGIGAVDNFQICIGLGRLTPDSRRSLFAGESLDDEEDFNPACGQGVILVDGQPLMAFGIPHISDKALLRGLLSHPDFLGVPNIS